VPYLSALEVYSRQDAKQIHVYLYLYKMTVYQIFRVYKNPGFFLKKPNPAGFFGFQWVLLSYGFFGFFPMDK